MLSPVLPDGTLTARLRPSLAASRFRKRESAFFIPTPLPYRRVIASLETGASAWIGFLVDLHWCRFTRYGWYESGRPILAKGGFTADCQEGERLERIPQKSLVADAADLASGCENRIRLREP